jgi:hypothetical protein
VKPRAFGKHPTGENPLHLSGELDLVHLDKGGGMRRLGGRARVADPRRHFEGPEFDCLVDGDLEMRDASRHLVECCEDGDRVLDRVGICELGRRPQCHSQGNYKEKAAGGDQTLIGKATQLNHAAHFMNWLPNSCPGSLSSAISSENRRPHFQGPL